MGGKDRTVVEVAGRIADSGHGIATRAELLAAGVTARETERRVEMGSLLREYRGVYRVGHRAPSIEATYLAAVKACGAGAALSGGAAAHVLEGAQRFATTARSHRAHRAARSGCHHPSLPFSRGSRAHDVARRAGDEGGAHAGRLGRDPRRGGTWLAPATRPGCCTAPRRRRSKRCCAQPKAAGAGNLRQVFRGDVDVTLNKLEREFLRLLEAAALPLPRTNKAVGGRRVDCRRHDQRLTAELDSYTFHSSRHAWEQDRRREREAYARGDAFRRYTWSDVFERPRTLLRELRGLLRGPRTTV